MALAAPPRAAPHPSPRRAVALTLALASLGFVSLGLPEGMLGVAWPSIRDTFDLPLDALGLLLATFATGYFISSAVSGRVIGRFNVGPVLAVSCGITGTCLVGYSLAPSWPAMVGLGAILGVGAGTIDGGLNTYAATAYGPRVLNWMHAAFGLGAAVGPLIMTGFLSSGLAWNAGYLVVALAQLGLAVGFWFARRRFTTRHANTETQTPHGPWSALLRQPLMWLSVLLFAVYVGMEAGTGQWSFSLFTLARNTPTALAGTLLSAYWASLTVGRIIFGLVVSHVRPERVLRACMLASVLAACLIWLNISLVSWAALAILGLSFAPVFPVLIAETPRRLGQTQAANAIGLQVAAAVLGGAALPSLLGVLAAHTSLEVVPPALVGAGLAQLGLHEALTRWSPQREL